LDGLRQQVEGCGHLAKKDFSATETEDLIKYLNDDHIAGLQPCMKSSTSVLALRSLPALEVIGSDSDLVAQAT
jgi:hypothetical protein